MMYSRHLVAVFRELWSEICAVCGRQVKVVFSLRRRLGWSLCFSGDCNRLRCFAVVVICLCMKFLSLPFAEVLQRIRN